MAKLANTVTVAGEYRVSRTPEGLRIDVLDYHAGPLCLDHETLLRVGLRFVNERRTKVRAPGNPRPRARRAT